jgi:predicted nucleic acid-binding Zn ribbon protein
MKSKKIIQSENNVCVESENEKSEKKVKKEKNNKLITFLCVSKWWYF